MWWIGKWAKWWGGFTWGAFGPMKLSRCNDFSQSTSNRDCVCLRNMMYHNYVSNPNKMFDFNLYIESRSRNTMPSESLRLCPFLKTSDLQQISNIKWNKMSHLVRHFASGLILDCHKTGIKIMCQFYSIVFLVAARSCWKRPPTVRQCRRFQSSHSLQRNTSHLFPVNETAS